MPRKLAKKNAVVYINNVHEFKKITLSRLKFLFFEGYLILTYLAL